LDPAGRPLRLAPRQVDAQQSVLEIGRFYLDAVRQHERATELARGYAAVDVLPGAVVLLPAAHAQLVVLDRDLDLFPLEPGCRQREAQPLRGAVVGAIAVRTADALDVEGGVAVAIGLADALDKPLPILKAQQKRARQQ